MMYQNSIEYIDTFPLLCYNIMYNIAISGYRRRNMEYYAHITEDGRKQTVLEHLKATSALCGSFAIDELKPLAELAALLHDIGKYSLAFQRRLKGGKEHFEHSVCGAIELHKRELNNIEKLFLTMLEYCIAGHHTGLPDGGTISDNEYEQTLQARLKREHEYIGSSDYSAYKEEINFSVPDLKKPFMLMFGDVEKGNEREKIERYAFFTRYLFSCLTDADFLDTERTFTPNTDRQLNADFDKVSEILDDKLGGFKADSDLQKARGRLLRQARENCKGEENVFLLNMPTGSGKTLCSLRLALDLLKKSGGKLKRIIYVIPYTSIIEQTAKEFTGLFGEYADILQHHSNFVYDENGEDMTAAKLQKACENWDSPFVITTNVQFFQSLYHYKGSGLRKLHNMGDSVIIFDEIHLLPIDVLQPCLRGIGYITKFLSSKAILLSATMPDMSRLFEEYLPNVRYKEIITERSDHGYFKKCKYTYLGKTDNETIVEKASQYNSSLIVVNSRKTAREVYALADGNKYHLSTYMTPADRTAVIERIKDDLKNGRKITVVSTSLIEAGVDLDFEAVFRQLAGLDSILQSGGRCNREGRRERGDVYIYSTEERPQKDLALRAEITEGLISEYDDITSAECIKEYFSRLLFNKQHTIDSNSIADNGYSAGIGNADSIAFRRYAEHFEYIKDETVAVVIDNCDESHELLEQIYDRPRYARRKLQRYSVGLKYFHEFAPMLQTGRIKEYCKDIYVLKDNGDYDSGVGLLIDRYNDIIVD